MYARSLFAFRKTTRTFLLAVSLIHGAEEEGLHDIAAGTPARHIDPARAEGRAQSKTERVVLASSMRS